MNVITKLLSIILVASFSIIACKGSKSTPKSITGDGEKAGQTYYVSEVLDKECNKGTPGKISILPYFDMEKGEANADYPIDYLGCTGIKVEIKEDATIVKSVIISVLDIDRMAYYFCQHLEFDEKVACLSSVKDNAVSLLLYHAHAQGSQTYEQLSVKITSKKLKDFGILPVIIPAADLKLTAPELAKKYPNDTDKLNYPGKMWLSFLISQSFYYEAGAEDDYGVKDSEAPVADSNNNSTE